MPFEKKSIQKPLAIEGQRYTAFRCERNLD
jgi:hypothetical protein